MKNTNILLAFTLALAFTTTPLLAENAGERGLERRDNRIERVENKMDKLGDRMEKQVVRKNGNATSTINATCAKAAIDIRSSAVLAAFNTHSSTVAALIASSTVGEKAAFDLTTNAERQKALRAVRQTQGIDQRQHRPAGVPGG